MDLPASPDPAAAAGPGQSSSPYPLDLGRTVALAWSLFRHAWLRMLGASAILLVPAYAVSVPLNAAFSPSVNRWLADAQAATQAGRATPPIPAGFDVAVIVLLSAGIVGILAALAAVGAIIAITDATFRGRPVSIGEALKLGLGRLPALAVAQLLLMLLVVLVLISGTALGVPLLIASGLPAFIGLVILMAMVVGVVYLTVRTVLIQQAVMLERVGGAESIARSWRLTTQSGWRVLGYVLFIGLIEGLLGLLLIVAPALLLRLQDTVAFDVALGTVIAGLAAIVLTPMSPVFLTMLYYDLRWRRGEPTPLPGSDVPAPLPAPLPLSLPR